MKLRKKLRKRGALQLWYSEPGYETVGSKDLTCKDWMVNTRTDADLSAAVQNALQALLPQIRAEIREEFRMSFGPSDASGNPPPVTIHTWLERFNKQKPHSFEKFFPRAEQERLKRDYHSIRQTNTETSTELCSVFFDLLVSSEQLLVLRMSRQRTFNGVFAGIQVMGVTRETEVSSPTNLPFM
nr:zinc finger, CCHC-type, retrotransposon Gag domain protein [Tanacetum cinerariifolium]